jgi:pimeloyl-ACP methyl ester carboxylesterase
MPFHIYNGLSMFYETFGTGQQVLLLIHGLGGNGSVWKYQIEYFLNKYQIVTVDQFGHGQSSKDLEPVFAPRVDAEAILSLMKEKFNTPYYVIGHSFAGLIMAEMINIGDSNLKGVVLVDCTYQGYNDVLTAREAFGQNMIALNGVNLHPETERWYKELVGPIVTPDDLNMILSSLQNCEPRWLFESVAGCKKYDSKYPQRTIPIRDGLSIFILEADRGVGSNIRKSWINHFRMAEYYLFENSYHFFFVVDHEKFNRLLARFLDEYK